MVLALRRAAARDSSPTDSMTTWYLAVTIRNEALHGKIVSAVRIFS
jgi:hypothetical protein